MLRETIPTLVFLRYKNKKPTPNEGDYTENSNWVHNIRGEITLLSHATNTLSHYTDNILI